MTFSEKIFDTFIVYKDSQFISMEMEVFSRNTVQSSFSGI